MISLTVGVIDEAEKHPQDGKMAHLFSLVFVPSFPEAIPSIFEALCLEIFFVPSFFFLKQSFPLGWP